MSRPGQTCTVKLPDPKDSAKDIWIDSPLAGSTPQDAQHRAALYALYQLGPTVPHDRVLPDPYKEVWSGWRATPPPPPRRDRDGGGGGGRGGGGGGRGDGGGRGGGGRGRGGGPSAPQASDVSMDEQTRESVQRALAAVRTDGGGSAAAASTAASDSRTDAAVARVVHELEKLGFGTAAANEAARAVHARDPAVGGAQLRERAVDWLCLQLPESELPHALQTRHRVQIVRPQIVRPPSAPAAKAPASEPPAAEDALLGRRGFSAADVMAALKEADGDKVAALLRLLRAVGRVGQQAWGDDDAAAVAEMREEEETALEAIYADGFTGSDEAGARACSGSSWRRSRLQAPSSFGCRPKAATRWRPRCRHFVRVARARRTRRARAGLRATLLSSPRSARLPPLRSPRGSKLSSRRLWPRRTRRRRCC